MTTLPSTIPNNDKRGGGGNIIPEGQRYNAPEGGNNEKEQPRLHEDARSENAFAGKRYAVAIISNTSDTSQTTRA